MNNCLMFETNTYRIHLCVDNIDEVFDDNNDVVILCEDLKLIFKKESHKEALECVDRIESLLEKADYGTVVQTRCCVEDEN